MYALTCNLSFASQKNLQVGSEADFVRACQRRKRPCFRNLLAGLDGLRERIAVAGFQEVVADQPETMAALRAILPALDAEYVASVWHGSALVSCMLRWNTDALGTAVWSVTSDLDVGRPVGVVVTRRDADGAVFLLVVAHFPWLATEDDLHAVEGRLATLLPPRSILPATALPIVMADTNDAQTLLHLGRPLRLGRHLRVHPGKTREQLRAHLKTCCWHETGHRYGHMTDTGDYVLSTHVEQQYVPRSFEAHRDDPFASDHLPVVARVRDER